MLNNCVWPIYAVWCFKSFDLMENLYFLRFFVFLAAEKMYTINTSLLLVQQFYDTFSDSVSSFRWGRMAVHTFPTANVTFGSKILDIFLESVSRFGWGRMVVYTFPLHSKAISPGCIISVDTCPYIYIYIYIYRHNLGNHYFPADWHSSKIIQLVNLCTVYANT